jgi:uncharacterized protein (DUF2141 family)
MTSFYKKFYFFIFALLSVSAYAQNTEVVVKISNIEWIKGSLMISLSNDSLAFAQFTDQIPTRFKKVRVKAHQQEIRFQNLKPGYYALAVFQDLNQNDSLDSRRFGIPIEPFGFSNNVLARFRPPSFKKASFYLKANQSITQSIHLIYHKPKSAKNVKPKNK